MRAAWRDGRLGAAAVALPIALFLGLTLVLPVGAVVRAAFLDGDGGFTLSPHLGLLLMSFAKLWSFTVLPDAWTLAHYGTILQDTPQMLGRTLLYCGVAAGVDALLAAVIAYLMLRTNLPGRRVLDYLATASLAVPGVVLGIGYLRLFKGVEVPGTSVALLATWFPITLAFTVRRLPYALRSCVASLQQVHPSLEEAATNLGATRFRVLRRIVLPLMLGGVIAGGITAFVTAAVELSVTIVLLASSAQAPVALGIYFYLQSMTGRGPGAALGVVAVAVVALGTWLSQRALRGRGALRE
ncbi:MAG: ABC transporter permease subunit [Verrucomicrobia bacterium]|nr:ABC transporter permease subunit [Verrucomicrobiota bacterium]